MSGIEVVGLALALWPVFGTLREVYSCARDGTAARWAVTIRVQERIFKESVSSLLQGDEELSEKDRVGLVYGGEDFESLWKDKEFNIRLESRLDAEMRLLIKHEVDEISKLVRDLRNTLGEPAQLETTKTKSFSLPRLRDVKRVLKKDQLRTSVDSLAFHNKALRKLLKICSNTAYADVRRPTTTAAAHQRSAASQAQQQQKRIDAQFFDDFHGVLCRSFRCKCTVAHEANLSVTDTLVMFQPGPSSPSSSSGNLPRALSDLRLRGRSATMDSAVTAYGDPDEEEEGGGGDLSEWAWSAWSRARQGSLSATPGQRRAALLLKYRESRGLQNCTPIPDLCQWIHALQAASPANALDAAETQGGLGGSGARQYTVQAQAAQKDAPLMDIVPMEEWLTAAGAEGKQRRRVRAGLAVDLASTIQQFYPTAWIEKTWTWQNFSVARNEAAASAAYTSSVAPSLVITQRFWSLDQPRQSSSSPNSGGCKSSASLVSSAVQATAGTSSTARLSKFWRMFCDLDPMLVRLGFALIELALGMRLSDIRSLRQKQDDTGGHSNSQNRSGADDGDVDLVDYYTAVDVLNSNEIEDEIGVAYQHVVEACLRCRVLSDAGMQVLKSDSGQFQANLEQFVVEPLRRLHSSTWGTAQVAAY